jgi:tetratricopeptide (TPR) repeat protein
MLDNLDKIWNIPLRNPDFTGRELILEETGAFLARTGENTAKQICLTGPSGFGKSEIAIEFAHRNSAAYHVIWRIDASHGISIHNDLIDLFGRLLPRCTFDIQTLHNWLESNPDWLLIFDNCAVGESLYEFLPEKRPGHIIIITDDPVTAPSWKVCPVDFWRRNESVACFLKKTGCINVKAIVNLAEALADHPLAIAIAASWCRAKTGPCSDNLPQLLVCLKKHSKDGLPKDDIQAIFTALCKLCLEELRDIPEVQQLLIVCSVMSSFPVPKYLVKKSLEIHGQISGVNGTLDEAAFDHIISLLEKYSLIKQTSSSITVQRIVKQAILKEVNHAELANYRKAAFVSLRELFPARSCQKPSRREACAGLVSHVRAILRDTKEKIDDIGPEYSLLQDAAAMFYHAQLFFSDAEALYRNSLEIRQKQLGYTHPEVATTLNNLALLYWDWDRIDDAESIYLESIRIREYHYGADHPEVATSLNNLALMFSEQERYSECELLFRRALTIRKKWLGDGDIMTAQSLNNLAGTLYRTGIFSESEIFFRLALDIYEQQLDPEHPELVTLLMNLASVMQAQGKMDEVETLCYRILSIREKQFDRNHPEIGVMLNNLAGILEAQGKYSEAIPVYQRALAINEINFGAEDSSSETIRLRLALIAGILA